MVMVLPAPGQRVEEWLLIQRENPTEGTFPSKSFDLGILEGPS